jgi:hypothetical protein
LVIGVELTTRPQPVDEDDVGVGVGVVAVGVGEAVGVVVVGATVGFAVVGETVGVVVVGATVGFADTVAAGVVTAGVVAAGVVSPGVDVVAVGTGVSTGPAPALQVTPFRMNLPGTGFAVPVRDPEKPSCAEPPWARAPFHDALVAVTDAPDWVATAPQAWVTC